MATETKIEDGIWLFRDESGDLFVAYIKDGMYSMWLRGTELYQPSTITDYYKPLRRIADLSGRPVVDERVIEKIATDHEWATRDVRYILRKHLLPQPEAGGEGKADNSQPPIPESSTVPHDVHAWGRQLLDEACGYIMEEPGAVLSTVDRDKIIAKVPFVAATPTTNRYRETATGDEWLFLPVSEFATRYGLRLRDKAVMSLEDSKFNANFTPIPAADAPIVNLPGAFPCWDKDGNEYVAWEAEQGTMETIGRRTKTTDSHTAEYFSDNFTRTRPVTLPPEHEKLVGPLADHYKLDRDELRRVMANASQPGSAPLVPSR